MVNQRREPAGNMGANQSASATAGQAKEQVQQKAADVKEQMQQTAADVKEQVATQATDKLAGQKDAASGNLNTVAQAFRQTGEQLRDNDQAGIAGYVERAADQVEQFAGYLGDRDLRSIARDTEAFARREPALFLGGAFALGVVAARFLKSSSQGGGRNWQGQADWYGQRPSPAIAPPPQLPAHTAGVGMGSGRGSSATLSGSGMGTSQAGMGTSSATTGIGSTADRGAPTPGTGSTAGRGTPTTASMGGTSREASMGTQPSDDVIVGGPPHEPGRGGQR